MALSSVAGVEDMLRTLVIQSDMEFDAGCGAGSQAAHEAYTERFWIHKAGGCVLESADMLL